MTWSQWFNSFLIPYLGRIEMSQKTIIDLITTGNKKMSTEVDALKAAVQAETAAVQAAVAELTTLSGQITSLTNQLAAAAGDPAVIADLTGQLQASAKTLNDSLAALTPVAPPAPTPVDPAAPTAG